MIQLTHPTARAAAAATALLGAFVFATPSFAASAASTAPGVESPTREASTHEAVSSASESSEAVDARINELHRRLHITEAQKPQWDELTKVMRENAQAMADVQKQRANDATSMTAVDVVKSYSDVIQAHEDGMKRFVPAFESLYNSLSDAQKKTADSMFRVRVKAEAKKVASKAS